MPRVTLQSLTSRFSSNNPVAPPTATAVPAHIVTGAQAGAVVIVTSPNIEVVVTAAAPLAATPRPPPDTYSQDSLSSFETNCFVDSQASLENSLVLCQASED